MSLFWVSRSRLYREFCLFGFNLLLSLLTLLVFDFSLRILGPDSGLLKSPPSHGTELLSDSQKEG